MSTLEVYQSKWNVFVSWCTDHNKDPIETTGPVLADFLIYLFQAKKLAASTIEGYRSAIAGALRHNTQEDLGKDKDLTALIQSFYRERPKPTKTHPPWDLSIVLWTLTEPPFEPIDSISLKMLTWKTAFLLLLASGARRSEVHALSFKSVRHEESWKWVSIDPIPTFVSKTQVRTRGASAFKGITIKALSTILCPDMKQDRALCPVRALKAYLYKTKELRKNKLLLLVSFQEGRDKDIHKNTISSWMRDLIRFCYANPSNTAAELTGTNTHTIRAMAATLAFRGNVELDDILDACTWKSHNTFTNFYLKDISSLQEGLLKLGPLVAAQRIVSLK